jgi:hypothetical protein
MAVAPFPASVKPCPTCGREIPETASLCESCEVWAAALVESRPAGEADEAGAGSGLDINFSVNSSEPAPVPAVPEPPAAAVATRQGPRRGLVIGAAAAVVVVLLAVGMRAARGPSSEAAAAAPAVAKTAPAAPAATSAVPPVAPVAATPATPASTPAVVQRWSTEKQATWLGNRRRGAAFELPADNVVKTWFGPARPSLVVRCVSHNLEVFVFTGSPMKIETRAAGKTVNLAMDDEPMQTERWPDSDDHDALFAPDAPALTRRLLTAQTFRFSYSPHNAHDVVAQFSVRGLDALLTAASKECGQ